MKIKLRIFFLLSIFIIAMTKVNAQTLSESYDNELSGEVAYKHLDYRGAKKVTFLLNNELKNVNFASLKKMCNFMWSSLFFIKKMVTASK